MIKAIATLKTDENWRERRRAARQLRHDPSQEAIAALLEAVDDFDDEVAEGAIRSLVYANRPEVAFLLTKHRFQFSKNSALRWTVAHALSKFGTKSHFDFLLRMSQDTDWSVRDEVFSAFDRILTELMEELETADLKVLDEDVHLLIRMMQIRQKSVRNKINAILVSTFQNLAPDLLLEALGSDNTLIITGIINVLGMLGLQSTISRLAEHAASKSVPVRLEVVKNVSKIGGPEAINLLVSRLGDGNPRVVSSARDALITLKHEPLFFDILTDRLTFVQDLKIQQNILNVMGRINDPRVIPSLFVNIGSSFYFIRQAATLALENYKELVFERVTDILNPIPISIAPFLEIAKDTNHLQARLRGIALLGRSKDPQAIKTLEKLYSDPSPEIKAAADEAMNCIFRSNWERANCAHLLGVFGNVSSVPYLLDSLTDWSIEVRSEAIAALRKLRVIDPPLALINAYRLERDAQIRSEIIACLGDAGQVNDTTEQTIVSALNDKSQMVRQQAARVLRLIGTKEEILPLLINHLADESIEVRAACLNSLHSLGETILGHIRKNFTERNEELIRFHCLNLIGLLNDLSMEAQVTAIAEGDKTPLLMQRAKVVLRTLKHNREVDREILFTEHKQ